mmetsp:Transcript_27643/g.54326  ORF Transcript_27643/g.54326 Transcript_27643/m.54326 type:complete len:1682 (+) Transcript_27643:23-5068(+)
MPGPAPLPLGKFKPLALGKMKTKADPFNRESNHVSDSDSDSSDSSDSEEEDKPLFSVPSTNSKGLNNRQTTKFSLPQRTHHSKLQSTSPPSSMRKKPSSGLQVTKAKSATRQQLNPEPVFPFNENWFYGEALYHPDLVDDEQNDFDEFLKGRTQQLAAYTSHVATSRQKFVSAHLELFEFFLQGNVSPANLIKPDQSVQQQCLTHSPSFLKNFKLTRPQLLQMNRIIRMFDAGVGTVVRCNSPLGARLAVLTLFGYLKAVRKLSGPHLVVTSESKVSCWVSDLQTFAPSLTFVRVPGEPLQLEDVSASVSVRSGLFDVYITTPGAMKLIPGFFPKIPMLTCCFDIENDPSHICALDKFAFDQKPSFSMILSDLPNGEDHEKLLRKDFVHLCLPTGSILHAEKLSSVLSTEGDEEKSQTMHTQLLKLLELSTVNFPVGSKVVTKFILSPLSQRQKSLYTTQLSSADSGIDSSYLGLRNILNKCLLVCNHPSLLSSFQPLAAKTSVGSAGDVEPAPSPPSPPPPPPPDNKQGTDEILENLTVDSDNNEDDEEVSEGETVGVDADDGSLLLSSLLGAVETTTAKETSKDMETEPKAVDPDIAAVEAMDFSSQISALSSLISLPGAGSDGLTSVSIEPATADNEVAESSNATSIHVHDSEQHRAIEAIQSKKDKGPSSPEAYSPFSTPEMSESHMTPPSSPLSPSESLSNFDEAAGDSSGGDSPVRFIPVLDDMGGQVEASLQKAETTLAEAEPVSSSISQSSLSSLLSNVANAISSESSSTNTTNSPINNNIDSSNNDTVSNTPTAAIHTPSPKSPELKQGDISHTIEKQPAFLDSYVSAVAVISTPANIPTSSNQKTSTSLPHQPVQSQQQLDSCKLDRFGALHNLLQSLVMAKTESSIPGAFVEKCRPAERVAVVTHIRTVLPFITIAFAAAKFFKKATKKTASLLGCSSRNQGKLCTFYHEEGEFSADPVVADVFCIDHPSICPDLSTATKVLFLDAVVGSLAPQQQLLNYRVGQGVAAPEPGGASQTNVYRFVTEGAAELAVAHFNCKGSASLPLEDLWNILECGAAEAFEDGSDQLQVARFLDELPAVAKVDPDSGVFWMGKSSIFDNKGFVAEAQDEISSLAELYPLTRAANKSDAVEDESLLPIARQGSSSSSTCQHCPFGLPVADRTSGRCVRHLCAVCGKRPWLSGGELHGCKACSKTFCADHCSLVEEDPTHSTVAGDEQRRQGMCSDCSTSVPGNRADRKRKRQEEKKAILREKQKQEQAKRDKEEKQNRKREEEEQQRRNEEEKERKRQEKSMGKEKKKAEKLLKKLEKKQKKREKRLEKKARKKKRKQDELSQAGDDQAEVDPKREVQEEPPAKRECVAPEKNTAEKDFREPTEVGETDQDEEKKVKEAGGEEEDEQFVIDHDNSTENTPQAASDFRRTSRKRSRVDYNEDDSLAAEKLVDDDAELVEANTSEDSSDEDSDGAPDVGGAETNLDDFDEDEKSWIQQRVKNDLLKGMKKGANISDVMFSLALGPVFRARRKIKQQLLQKLGRPATRDEIDKAEERRAALRLKLLKKQKRQAEEKRKKKQKTEESEGNHEESEEREKDEGDEGDEGDGDEGDKEHPKQYEVEYIVRQKKERGKLLFEVKWKGYSHEDNTWQDLESIKSCKQVLKNWRKQQKQEKAKKAKLVRR